MISCIVPTHNDSENLERTLKSCMANACVEEIIVVDDCSDAKHKKHIEAIAKQYFAILITNQINYGLAGSRNKGIEKATYDWIIPLDTGDEFYRAGIDQLWQEARRDSFKSDIYYGFITHGKDIKFAFAKKEITEEDFLTPVNPLFCSSLFSKDVWLKAGGYTMYPFSHYEDYSFWMKCWSVGAKFKYCNVQVYHHDDPGDSMLTELHEHTNAYKELARTSLQYGKNKKCYKPKFEGGRFFLT